MLVDLWCFAFFCQSLVGTLIHVSLLSSIKDWGWSTGLNDMEPVRPCSWFDAAVAFAELGK